jgi:hypothetical protein
MSIELDQENARDALDMCHKKFHGRKLATGHNIIVASVTQVPRFLNLEPKGTGVVISLSIEDHRCADAVTLYAVRHFFDRFEVYYMLDGSIVRDDGARSLADLHDALDCLLEQVDSHDVSEAIADHCKFTDR